MDRGNNINVDRIAFMEKVGFSRIILGRELSLEQIKTIRQSTNSVELETFVQGALCVCLCAHVCIACCYC